MTGLNPSQPRKTVGLDTFAVKPVVMSIFDFSAEALGELKTWLEQNPPFVPVTQIIGFSQFTAQIATDPSLAAENGTSAASTPNLAALPDGQYLIVWGGTISSSVGGTVAGMGISLNGGAYDSTLAATTTATSASSVASGTVQRLVNNGSNTIDSIYKGATGTFSNRWLIAFKFANP